VPSEEAIAGALEEAEATDQKLKLLWIGCGKDDFLLRRNEEFVARLKEKQLDHEWHLTEGNQDRKSVV
jgi:enterochelin esterase family protein